MGLEGRGGVAVKARLRKPRAGGKERSRPETAMVWG